MSRRSEPDSEILHRFPLRGPTALCEAVEGGAVALQLQTGDYYELSATGLFVWEECGGEADGYRIATRLAAAYGATRAAAEADTAAFLRELMDSQLLVLLHEPRPAG